MKEQSWLEEGWFYHNHAWHLLHEIIKLIPEKTVSILDVGAGTGMAAAIIKAIYPEIEITVTDISENSVSFWERRGLNGIVNKEMTLPFEDCQFDFVMSSHVLEHIESEKTDIFVKELSRVCNKRIVIVVPDGDVNFYDHQVIYDRSVFNNTIEKSLKNEKYIKKSFPIYHSHINNLVAVIDK